MSISLSSLFGYPPLRRKKICSHRYTSCAQYSASSCSMCGGNSVNPAVLLIALPLAGKPKSSASFAKLLPTSTPRIARAIESVSNIKTGCAPYRQDKIATSNCALCASTAVRLQSIVATHSAMSCPRTHLTPSKLPNSCTHNPNALNLLSLIYSSVVSFFNVYSLLS